MKVSINSDAGSEQHGQVNVPTLDPFFYLSSPSKMNVDGENSQKHNTGTIANVGKHDNDEHDDDPTYESASLFHFATLLILPILFV